MSKLRARMQSIHSQIRSEPAAAGAVQDKTPITDVPPAETAAHNQQVERMQSNAQAVYSHAKQPEVTSDLQSSVFGSPKRPSGNNTTDMGWDRRFRHVITSAPPPSRLQQHQTPAQAAATTSAETSMLHKDAKSVVEIK